MAQSKSTFHNGISLMIEITHNTSPFGKSHGQWLSSVQWRIDILRPKPLTASSKSLPMNITASESNCNSIAPPLVKHYLDLRSSRSHFVTHLDDLCHSYLDVRTPLCMDHFKPPSNNIMQQRTTLFQPTDGDRHCLLCDKI